MREPYQPKRETWHYGRGVWTDDMDPGHVEHKQKVVKTRAYHHCTFGREVHPIETGEMALCETAIFPGEGRKSNYFCLECLDKWMDESGL